MTYLQLSEQLIVKIFRRFSFNWAAELSLNH